MENLEIEVQGRGVCFTPPLNKWEIDTIDLVPVKPGPDGFLWHLTVIYYHRTILFLPPSWKKYISFCAHACSDSFASVYLNWISSHQRKQKVSIRDGDLAVGGGYSSNYSLCSSWLGAGHLFAFSASVPLILQKSTANWFEVSKHSQDSYVRRTVDFWEN